MVESMVKSMVHFQKDRLLIENINEVVGHLKGYGCGTLVGFPLAIRCNERTQRPQIESQEDHEEESGFTWEVVMLGYGCGTLVGLVMGYLMLSTRKVKWFNAIADALESLVLKKRRHVYIGK
ncbi:hypothetical protein Tco_0252907 [Tanacetum coccineum]